MNIFLDLIIATIFGGMMTFQLLFAPLIFIKLENTTARSFIRGFFPFYYLYFAILCLIGCVFTVYLNAYVSLLILAGCLIGFVFSRQALMPKANDATDAGNKKRFNYMHRLTVLINTLQLIAVGFLIYLD